MKVLLIAPYFPPANAIGALRSGKLAKYLTSHGHEVRVVASETPEIAANLPLEVSEKMVVRCRNFAPDTLLIRSQKKSAKHRSLDKMKLSPSRWLPRSLFQRCYSTICIPDRFYGWIIPALGAGRRLTRSGFKPDIVFASAQPYSALLVGRSIAQKHDIPFIAEFRDLWTDNHYSDLPSWRSKIDRQLEHIICRNAAAVITVSEPLAEILVKRHNRPTQVIYNGFDPMDLPGKLYVPRKTFEIVYTGIIYPGRRDPSQLFRVLRRLGESAANVRVRFYGRRLETVCECAAREGVSHLVTVEGEISHHEALKRQAKADILLLLLWDTPKEKGVLTGKLFEYFGSRRPILLIGSHDGNAADLIRERRAGYVATRDEDLEAQMRRWLYQHARSGIPTLPKNVGIGFSRDEQFARLTDCLERNAHRKKLIVVTRKLDIGGTERHLVQVLPSLNRDLFNCEVLSIYRDGLLEEALRKEGVRVIAPRTRLRILAFIESALRLLAKMHQERSATFHFWLPEAYLLGGACGVAIGNRRMMMSRRSLNLYQKRHPWLARFERLLHRRMRLILANSDEIARELLAEGVPQDRLQVIKNGLDLGKFATTKSQKNVREKLGIPQNVIVFICVANLIYYKGHSDLFEAMALMQSRIGTRWRLLCVGRDDGLGAVLAKQVRDLGIGKNVIFLGLRNDVPDLLRASDVSVLASHEEGFSNAVIESMGMGLPVVATAVGGNVEAVEDGSTGLLTPPRDPRRLAEKLVLLATDIQLRQNLSVKARKDISVHRTLETCIASYKEAYGRVFARGQ